MTCINTQSNYLRQGAMQKMRCNTCGAIDAVSVTCLMIRPHPHMAHDCEGSWEETVSQAAGAGSLGAVERVASSRYLA